MKFIYYLDVTDAVSHYSDLYIPLKKILGSGVFDGVELVRNEISDDGNPSRTWSLNVGQTLFNAFSDYQEELFKVKGVSLFLTRVEPKFSRYEEKKMLMFIIYTPDQVDYDGEFKDELKIKLQEKYALPGTNDSFSFIQKMSVRKDRIELVNPVPLMTEAEFNHNKFIDYEKIQGKGYVKYVKIAYGNAVLRKNKQFAHYLRKQSVVFVLNNDEKISKDLIALIHTEFMFFLRGLYLEESLQNLFDEVDFLQELTTFIQKQWVKIRTVFSVTSRFGMNKKREGSNAFFQMLEVNGQSTSLLSKIKYDMRESKAFYEEAFERLQFTVASNGTEEEVDYFKKLESGSLTLFSKYQEKVDVLSESIHMMTDNIEKLRSDFDSSTNMIMQWLMFLLSIVIVIWGAMTVFYDKVVLPFDFAISNPWELAVLGLFGLLAIVIISYLFFAWVWINRNARPLNKQMEKLVKNWLNNGEVDDAKAFEAYQQDYLSDQLLKEMNYQKKIAKSLELISIIIPAISLNKLSATDAKEILKEIKSKFLQERKVVEGSVKFSTKMILEQLTESKNGNDHLNEDGICITDDFVVVIDGATSQSTFEWDGGKSGGKLAMEIIKEKIKELDGDIDYRSFVDKLTEALSSYYKDHLTSEMQVELYKNPEQRVSASLVAYSVKKHEIWMIGDCQSLVGGVPYTNPKAVDEIVAGARALYLEGEMHEGKKESDLLSNDTGRHYIQPLLVRQRKLQNNHHSLSPFAYSVLDGFSVPMDGVKRIKLPKDIVPGQGDIILATDGYPVLYKTLQKTENELRQVLKKDPLCINENIGTKGLKTGMLFYDDRSYVRF